MVQEVYTCESSHIPTAPDLACVIVYRLDHDLSNMSSDSHMQLVKERCQFKNEC